MELVDKHVHSLIGYKGCHQVRSKEGKLDVGSEAEQATRKATGRPRRLTLDQVLEAAHAVGLENLTMSAVARQLGVKMPVLYGYVASRDELVRLVAARANRESAYVADVGQHWSVYIAQVAVGLYSFFIGPGQLVSYFLSGGLGPEVELDRAEVWLEKMTQSGFTAREAVIIQRQMGEIVVGGAVTFLHARALEAAGRPFRPSAIEAIQTRADELPLLAAQQDLFAQREVVWHQTLLVFITSLADRTGEILDQSAIMKLLTEPLTGTA